jgi:crossover junction endodeoxyribonuclease RuvC
VYWLLDSFLFHRVMIIGIDPGLSGALAFYWPDIKELQVIDMPTYGVTMGKSRRRVLDLAALCKHIGDCAERDTPVFLEEVHAMPKQGVASSFTFGRVFGAIEGMLAALKIPVTRVPPNVWKRALRCTFDKDAARRRASELLPHHAYLWALKKHDGRAEAALLAYYGAQNGR